MLHISPGEKSGLFFISGLINCVTIATLKSISKHRSIPLVRNADIVSKLKNLRLSSRILDLHNHVFMHLCNGFVPVVSVLMRFNCTNMRPCRRSNANLTSNKSVSFSSQSTTRERQWIYASAFVDECFVSSELRKVGKTGTFPVLLWSTKLSFLRLSAIFHFKA